jgi:hypothetical protein
MSDQVMIAARESANHKMEVLSYEPKHSVKESFLPLRKLPRTWGGVSYPGLFNHNPANDAGWFWFTVIMEIVSLGISAILLEEKVFASLLIISPVVIFFLDFAFAYGHHRYKAAESIFENRKRLFYPGMRGKGIEADMTYSKWYDHIEQRFKDSKDRKYGRYIFGFWIWLLCFGKGGIFFVAVFSSFWFQTAVTDSKLPFLIIIAVIFSYFWIALNHLKYTGYFLASCWNNLIYKSDEARYKRTLTDQGGIKRNDGRAYSEVDFHAFIRFLMENPNAFISAFSRMSEKEIEESKSIGIFEVKCGSHSIKKIKDNIYLFEKDGFLLDDDIEEMVRVQKNDLARFAVAMYFHGLQMQSLNS